MQKLYWLLGIHIGSDAARDELRAAFRDGMKTVLPIFPATFIWAVVTAVAMVAAGMSPLYVLLINLVVYASSAQLAVLTMLMSQAPLPIIWLAAAAVNLRFVIFSASLKPYFRHLNLPRRLFYGFINGDIVTMLFGFRYRNESPHEITHEQTGFYLGMAMFNYTIWQLGCLLGILFAGLLPVSWGLELAASLTLLVLVIKGVEHWAGVAGCLVATLVAVGFNSWPYKLWLPLAIVCGVAVALLIENVLPKAYLRARAAKGEQA